LIREQGAYMPGVYEKVIEHVKGTTITETTALQMKALDNFTDVYNVKRRAGEVILRF
jgi:major vault protein